MWAKKVNEYRSQNIKPNSKCAFCGSKEDLTIDHIIPRSILLRMGYNPMETWELKKNLIIVCKKCNTEKAGTICLKLKETHEALKEIIKKNPPQIL